MFSRSGFSEKEELNSEDFSLEWVEEKIVSWKSPGLYYSHFPNRDGYDSRFKGYLNKFGRLNRRFGAATLLKMGWNRMTRRSEEHTSELQSRGHLVCRLL